MIAMRVSTLEENCRSNVYFHCNSSNHHDHYLPISVVTTTDPHYHQRHVHFEDEELDEMEDENEKTKMMKKKLVPITIKVSKQPEVVPFWEVGNQRLVPNRSINQDTLNFRRLFSPSTSSQTHNDYNDDGNNNKEELCDG